MKLKEPNSIFRGGPWNGDKFYAGPRWIAKGMNFLAPQFKIDKYRPEGMNESGLYVFKYLGRYVDRKR